MRQPTLEQLVAINRARAEAEARFDAEAERDARAVRKANDMRPARRRLYEERPGDKTTTPTPATRFEALFVEK